MLHDFVGRAELPSAVRLNATFRSLGILSGPSSDQLCCSVSGRPPGIFVNIAFYLPLTLFLFRTRFTGHTRDDAVARPRVGIIDSLRVFREVRADRMLVSMIVLAGLGSFFVGASLADLDADLRQRPRAPAARGRPTACCSSPTASAACSAASCSRRPAGSSRTSGPR